MEPEQIVLEYVGDQHADGMRRWVPGAPGRDLTVADVQALAQDRNQPYEDTLGVLAQHGDAFRPAAPALAVTTSSAGQLSAAPMTSTFTGAVAPEAASA